ncbi:MAG TPA: hypothetical protein VHM24_05030 [Gemmatimonadaceae bacterium]|nr:hypothetical protein [Gemmatimonadaceae bacterium]
MRSLSLAVIAVAVGVVACREVVTAPDSAVDPSLRNYSSAPSNPPPPDVDTSVAGQTGGTTFELRVRYFFNPAGNSGWIKFDSEIGDVTVDKNAQIRYSNGVFSGKGLVTVGDVVIDLTRVSQTSQFSSCKSWTNPPEPVTPTADTAPVGCFNVVIDGINGTPVYLTEGCPTDKSVYDPRRICYSREAPPADVIK